MNALRASGEEHSMIELVEDDPDQMGTVASAGDQGSGWLILCVMKVDGLVLTESIQREHQEYRGNNQQQSDGPLDDALHESKNHKQQNANGRNLKDFPMQVRLPVVERLGDKALELIEREKKEYSETNGAEKPESLARGAAQQTESERNQGQNANICDQSEKQTEVRRAFFEIPGERVFGKTQHPLPGQQETEIRDGKADERELQFSRLPSRYSQRRVPLTGCFSIIVNRC